MNVLPDRLGAVRGQSFFKLMGTGKGLGFNPRPDWSTYCLLQVWFNRSYAEDFFNNSGILDEYIDASSGVRTLWLQCLKSDGKWSGRNPFGLTKKYEGGKVGIITRATIRTRHLVQFWKNVPAAQAALEGAKGLLFAKGMGEVPLVQMATFSLWEDMSAVYNYAYKSEEHKHAIAETRRLDWYKEEMFARFQLLKDQPWK